MAKAKLLVTLFALGLIANSSGTYALKHSKRHKITTHDNSTIIFIPKNQPGFEFGVTALALKPGASNLNYVIYSKESPVQSPSWTEKEIRPGYSAAFALVGGYRFLAGQDITLDWTHLNNSSSAAIATPNTSHFLGPDYETGPNSLNINNAYGSSTFKYDVVNLSAGQRVNIGRPFEVRFFGGLSTAFLREQVDTTYSGNVLVGQSTYPGPFHTQQEVTANFSGIGPRFGIGGNYTLGNGFGLLGEAAASALIGSTYSKTSYSSSSQELIAVYGQGVNYQFIKDQNVLQVVPGFDAKLGVSYHYVFDQGTILTIKGGYQAAVYINAISQYLPGSLVDESPIQTGSVFVSTMNHTLSNYSVQGPFLEAEIKI